MVSATTEGASPKHFSRSAETGRSVASTIMRALASNSSRVTLPSRLPSAPALAPLAPGLPDLGAVRAVCSAVSKPVNFMTGIKGKSFTVAELDAAGVRRISLATSLYRIDMTGLVEAAREVKDKGTFGYIDRSIPTPDLAAFMQS